MLFFFLSELILIQFSAHLFPNLITPPIVDLRVDCKGRTGLRVSGFCGHRCHTDIWIGQQDAHEGVPEHMRMNLLDSSFPAYPVHQCAVAIRVDYDLFYLVFRNFFQMQIILERLIEKKHTAQTWEPDVTDCEKRRRIRLE